MLRYVVNIIFETSIDIGIMQAREADGKRPSQEVLDKMAYVLCIASLHSQNVLTC